MNLTEVEFENVTPAYFNIRLTGLRRHQQQKEQAEWERARWVASMVMSPHLKNPIRPQQLVTFPWEKRTENVYEWIERNKQLYDKLTPN